MAAAISVIYHTKVVEISSLFCDYDTAQQQGSFLQSKSKSRDEFPRSASGIYPAADEDKKSGGVSRATRSGGRGLRAAETATGGGGGTARGGEGEARAHAPLSWL